MNFTPIGNIKPAYTACEIDQVIGVQDSNSFLEDFMTEKGFLLTCTAYPEGDLTLQTNQEENVYD